MKKKFNDLKWIVWNWDFNTDSLEEYNVIPVFINEFNQLKKKDKPKTLDELSEWLDHEATYYFWSKCECEMIIHGWPAGKNDKKVDIYQQLKLNWDVFVIYFWNNVVMGDI